MTSPCWITNDGKFIPAPNPYDHMNIAAEHFPDSANPEKTVEDMGWLKISGYGKAQHIWISREPTQAQLDTMFRLWPDDYAGLIEIIATILS